MQIFCDVVTARFPFEILKEAAEMQKRLCTVRLQGTVKLIVNA
jgi:hypothetical protein